MMHVSKGDRHGEARQDGLRCDSTMHGWYQSMHQEVLVPRPHPLPLDKHSCKLTLLSTT